MVKVNLWLLQPLLSKIVLNYVFLFFLFLWGFMMKLFTAHIYKEFEFQKHIKLYFTYYCVLHIHCRYDQCVVFYVLSFIVFVHVSCWEVFVHPVHIRRLCPVLLNIMSRIFDIWILLISHFSVKNVIAKHVFPWTILNL